MLVEAPSASFDDLTCDGRAFMMQEVKRQEEQQVSRQRVLVYVPLSFFVHRLAQPEWLGITGFLLLQS